MFIYCHACFPNLRFSAFAFAISIFFSSLSITVIALAIFCFCFFVNPFLLAAFFILLLLLLLLLFVFFRSVIACFRTCNNRSSFCIRSFATKKSVVSSESKYSSKDMVNFLSFFLPF
ncbi:hypothetical protein BDF20DRAFT_851370 [Mycotypha africana]|uniref:uncharacterized protein n=1 Tax=Mycotypha africana TaxID=64632 RepID=UPI00230146EF|nr:uncharacterized protein BDF20DRAFT_851370 [Mycotypha africana]KAI8987642.1 hypothetical protein BDF20DRAFT_851370 [Mycotypha africana]